MARDVVGRCDETLAGEPLLQPVVRGGERLAAGCISLEAARPHGVPVADGQKTSLSGNLLWLRPLSQSFLGVGNGGTGWCFARLKTSVFTATDGAPTRF